MQVVLFIFVSSDKVPIERTLCSKDFTERHFYMKMIATLIHSYKLSYKLAFILFLAIHINQKQLTF